VQPLWTAGTHSARRVDDSLQRELAMRHRYSGSDGLRRFLAWLKPLSVARCHVPCQSSKKTSLWLTPFLIGSGGGVAGHRNSGSRCHICRKPGSGASLTEEYGKWLKGTRALPELFPGGPGTLTVRVTERGSVR
jgi:hypothetical protein